MLGFSEWEYAEIFMVIGAIIFGLGFTILGRDQWSCYPLLVGIFGPLLVGLILVMQLFI